MAKKPKRDLSLILDDIDAVLKSDTANIIRIGTLLIEAKALVDHGKWLPLLKQRFDFSERTARNYISAAKYAAEKSAPIADLKLSPSVLYALAGRQSIYLEVEDRILKAAETDRVDGDRAHEILQTLYEEERQKEANAKSEPKPGNQSQNDCHERGAGGNVVEPDPNRWKELTADQAAPEAAQAPEQKAAEVSKAALSGAALTVASSLAIRQLRRFKRACNSLFWLMSADDLEEATRYALETAEACRSRLRKSKPVQEAA